MISPRRNQQRGREGKHPVTYMECMDISNRVLAANKIPSHTNFYNGDSYVGSRQDELKEKNAKIDALEKEVARLKSQLKQLEGR